MYLSNISRLPIKSIAVSENIAKHFENVFHLCRCGRDKDMIYFVWQDGFEEYINKLPIFLKLFGKYELCEGGQCDK